MQHKISSSFHKSLDPEHDINKIDALIEFKFEVISEMIIWHKIFFFL